MFSNCSTDVAFISSLRMQSKGRLSMICQWNERGKNEAKKEERIWRKAKKRKAANNSKNFLLLRTRCTRLELQTQEEYHKKTRQHLPWFSFSFRQDSFMWSKRETRVVLTLIHSWRSFRSLAWLRSIRFRPSNSFSHWLKRLFFLLSQLYPSPSL